MAERTPIPPTERLQVRPYEAAELLSISERELWRKTKSGEIPAIGTRRLRRYAIEDLRAWQDRNRNGGDDA
jgi:excisionase family DNA binding protein